MSFGETGALSASASSCALSVTLPRRLFMERMASLRLFCRGRRRPLVTGALPQAAPVRRGCHTSSLASLAPFAGNEPGSSLSVSASSEMRGVLSSDNEGNLKLF